MHDVIYDSNDLAYEIIGFLQEGSYYIASGEKREPVYLDQVIVKLSEVNAEDSVDLLDYFVTTYYITKDNDFMKNVVKQSSDYSDKRMAGLRNEVFGFVMQDFALIERCTVEKM